jgi:hypothetical protein
MENPSPSEQAKFPVSELIRAILAFDHVIQDRDCPSGKFQWEQNQLIKLVRARDIPLNLAMAALTKLISKGEIEKGKSFVHLNDVTDLSGKCLTSSTVHDCYLHFLLADWNTFIAEFKRQLVKEPAPMDYPGQGLKVPEESNHLKQGASDIEPVTTVTPAVILPKKADLILKRSTKKGGARLKIISALSLHHKYADSSILNSEPIKNSALAKLAGVAKSTVTEFFNIEFNSYAKYREQCHNLSSILASLKTLNGEFSPKMFNLGNNHGRVEDETE